MIESLNPILNERNGIIWSNDELIESGYGKEILIVILKHIKSILGAQVAKEMLDHEKIDIKLVI